jgi:hypothetical protein
MPFPVDEKYVIQTEQKLGVRFPDSFREKMQTDNGGLVVTLPDAWTLYPFFDTSDKKRLKRTSNDLVRETEPKHRAPVSSAQNNKEILNKSASGSRTRDGGNKNKSCMGA